MLTEELLELLDIDVPEEFEYFEHLAELLECTEDISPEAFCAVLMEVDQKVLTELLETYFEDVLQGIPEDALDFYTLMTTIRQSLLGLSMSASQSEMLGAPPVPPPPPAEDLVPAVPTRQWYDETPNRHGTSIASRLTGC